MCIRDSANYLTCPVIVTPSQQKPPSVVKLARIILQPLCEDCAHRHTLMEGNKGHEMTDDLKLFSNIKTTLEYVQRCVKFFFQSSTKSFYFHALLSLTFSLLVLVICWTYLQFFVKVKTFCNLMKKFTNYHFCLQISSLFKKMFIWSLCYNPDTNIQCLI